MATPLVWFSTRRLGRGRAARRRVRDAGRSLCESAGDRHGRHQNGARAEVCSPVRLDSGGGGSGIYSHRLDDDQREIRAPHSPFVRDIGLAVLIFLFWVVGMGLWRFRFRRQFQIQQEDHTLDETEWGLHLRGHRREPNPPRSGQSFWLLLRRSALSLVFCAIMAFKAPWRHHFALALVCYVALPLVVIPLSTLLVQRTVKKRRRFQRPPLSFLFGFPVAVTLLIVDLDLISAGGQGDRIGPRDRLFERSGNPRLCRLGTIFCSQGQTARAPNSLLITAESTVLAANPRTNLTNGLAGSRMLTERTRDRRPNGRWLPLVNRP